MPLKNCKNCNTEFYSTPKLRIYCSKECSDRARKDQVNKYYKEYQKRPEVKEKLNKYRREYQKRPHIREYQSKWHKEYIRRPDIKEKLSQYYKQDRVKKAMKESNKKWKSKIATDKLIQKYLDKKIEKKFKAEVFKIIKKKGHITNGQLRLIERKGSKNKKYNKKYFATEKGKKKRVENMTAFYKNNLEARLALRMRHRIKEFMKIKKMTKKNKTFHMIGCTPQELKLHLESQFKDGMTWDNWTVHGWHIDHIIPLDSAKNEEDLKKLCHYSNLQPMWATENREKSNKIL